jgi:hypothetical protein
MVPSFWGVLGKFLDTISHPLWLTCSFQVYTALGPKECSARAGGTYSFSEGVSVVTCSS